MFNYLTRKQDVMDMISSLKVKNSDTMNFLMKELFVEQDDYIQTFLLCTSMLDKMCGPLCDAIIHPSYLGLGKFTLEYLCQKGIVVAIPDGERTWFRYHEEFKKFLCEYYDTMPVNTCIIPEKEMRYRVSRWYSSNSLGKVL